MGYKTVINKGTNPSRVSKARSKGISAKDAIMASSRQMLKNPNNVTKTTHHQVVDSGKKALATHGNL